MLAKFSVCLLLVATITGGLSMEWEQYKREYNKKYRSAAEEAERKQIYLENVARMEEYRRTHPDAPFTMAINHLADRRSKELVTGSKMSLDHATRVKGVPLGIKSDVPTSWDWREKGVISEVYDQGMQSIVSSIAAVEVIESYHAIYAKQLVRGSVNQVTQCCEQDISIFNCILQKLGGGICTEKDYNSSLTVCSSNTCTPFARFDKVNRYEPGDENEMLTLIQDSTLYVGLDVSQPSLLLYMQGIYKDPQCSKTTIDHVMQLVGYGVEGGVPFWILKNSWGHAWGEQGYIRLERGTNMCGITVAVEQIHNTKGNGGHLVTGNGFFLVLLCFALYVFSRQ